MYGVGSKIETLNSFQGYLESQNFSNIRINAYNPTITIRKVLNYILKFLQKPEKTHQSLDRVLCETLSALDHSHKVIFLLIDSIDSSSLIDQEYQLIISRLSIHKNIHLIATLDNSYLLYRWSIETNTNYNFLYIPCVTYNSYSTELSFTEGLKIFDYSTTHNQLRGIDYVLKSLTMAQRMILKELAYSQLKEPSGLTFKDFSTKCVEETLILTSKQLKDLLVEAIDHQIAAYKVGQNGENMIYLKIDPVILINKIG